MRSTRRPDGSPWPWSVPAAVRDIWWTASRYNVVLLSGVPDYFCRNKISSGGDLSHYSSASLY